MMDIIKELDVSVIIVNYKTIGLVLDCIKSIKEKTMGISYEIIVVDNDSGDDCMGVITKEFGKDNNIIFIGLSENVGFGKANNEGLKKTRGRYVLFLNPDTVLLNNSIQILSDYLDMNPHVGVCGGNLYDEQMKPTLSYMTFLPSITREFDELTHGWISRLKNGKSSNFNYSNKPLPVGYITGADMMTRKKILDEIGAFSSAFFMYYEETELTYRVKKAGFMVHSVPSAKIQHLEGKSFRPAKVNKNKIKMSEQGRITYYRLHYSALYRVIANLIYGAFLFSRYILLHRKERALSYRYRLECFQLL